MQLAPMIEELERAGAMEVAPLLRAFGTDDDHHTNDGFAAAAAHARNERVRTHGRIEVELDVDGAQARMFARRWNEVLGMLDRLGDHGQGAAGRVLATAFVLRTEEILDAGARGLRVRAIADFYYSQAVRLRHVASRRSIEQVLVGERFTEVAPGVEHLRLSGAGPAGPMHLNLLRVRDRRLRAFDNRPEGDLVGLCTREGAVAGTSGGFFLYSEPDIDLPSRRTDPVGLLVSDGRLINPPVFRRGALVQHANGDVQIERIGLPDLWAGPGELRMNEESPGPAAWTRAWGRLAPEQGLQVVGTTVIGHGRAIPLAGFVLTGAPAPEFRVPFEMGIAGGPMLQGPSDAGSLTVEDFAGSAPPITFSQDETYDQNLLPRLVVGSTEEGALVFAAIDGRNPKCATGFTLGQSRELLDRLGCTRSLNLDGGSSKRMVLQGRQLDLASTEVGSGGARVRPVHSALLIV